MVRGEKWTEAAKTQVSVRLDTYFAMMPEGGARKWLWFKLFLSS
jgi:hypothetical protein